MGFPGISVDDIRITSQGANPNTVNTFWTESNLDLSRGLDFTPRGSIFAQVTHLNHDPFTYNFIVNNQSNQDQVGTARIFIAPRFDENNRPLNFEQQRNLAIEMDKFTVRRKIFYLIIHRK